MSRAPKEHVYDDSDTPSNQIPTEEDDEPRIVYVSGFGAVPFVSEVQNVSGIASMDIFRKDINFHGTLSSDLESLRDVRGEECLDVLIICQPYHALRVAAGQEDQQRFANVAKQLLRPGGFLGMQWIRAERNQTTHHAAKRVREALGGEVEVDLRGSECDPLMWHDGMDGTLSAAGFDTLRQRKFREQSGPHHLEVASRMLWASLDESATCLGSVDAKAVRAIGTALRDVVTEDGTLSLDFFVHCFHTHRKE